MGRSELEEKIMEFALDEGILGKKIPANEKLEFGYELNYPPQSPKPMKIIVIKAKDRKAISLQIATQIAQQQLDALTKADSTGLMKFFAFLKKYLLSQNLLYNLDLKNARYIVSDIIYPDGLTENNFYLALRKMYNTFVFINIQLSEIIGRNFPKGNENSADMEFSGGNFMFT